LTLKEARLLEEHRARTARLYCHGCGHHCEAAAGGLAIADTLRFLRYHEVYGKRRRARELYLELPQAAREGSRAQLEAAEAACPHGVRVVDLMLKADGLLS
jgi:hypothetical protein